MPIDKVGSLLIECALRLETIRQWRPFARLVPVKFAPVQLIRNVAILGSGTAFAQAVNVIATPLLAYLYAPESFGVMAVFMGIVLVVGSMASLTYDSAIILPKDNDDAISLFVISNIISLIISSLLFFVMIIVYVFFNDAEKIPGWMLCLLIPFGAFSLNFFNACTNWLIRSDAFRCISAAIVIRSTSATCIQVVSGFLGLAGLGLVIGRIGGQFIATTYIAISSGLLCPRYWRIDVSQLRAIAVRYYRFPIFKAPQQVIVLISEQLPAFALAAFFGAGFAGLYWLADRILKLPCTVLSEAAAKVFFSECTKKSHSETSLMPITIKTMATLGSVAIVPSVIIFYYAPSIFSLLGEEWEPASLYIKWMIVWVFFRFSCSPIMSIFTIIDQQKLLLNIDTVAMLIRIPLIICFGLFGDHNSLVMAVCIFESLKIFWTVLQIVWTLRKLECPWNHLTGRLSDVCTSSSPE